MYFQSISGDLSVAPDGKVLPPVQALRPSNSTLLVKSLFDRVFAGFALLAVLPALVLISVAILLIEGGPVYYHQERVGRNGRLFRCWKFRTMVPDAEARLAATLSADPALRAEWEATRKLQDDPRIRRLGHFLRKTSLDELPQFWNVLRGDMSVVGPRPVVLDELTYYGTNAGDYMSVPPGLTGAWQVSGRSNTTYAERVALDMDYIHNMSLRRDLTIIWKTVGAVLGQSGAR